MRFRGFTIGETFKRNSYRTEEPEFCVPALLLRIEKTLK